MLALLLGKICRCNLLRLLSFGGDFRYELKERPLTLSKECD
ncbi:hypothetical protein SynSYN20_00298 [Synechococcus sp. SYN20]|nr:hypothetical protein SynSYN20_00298 [Synechococcus sp. SYN20]